MPPRKRKAPLKAIVEAETEEEQHGDQGAGAAQEQQENQPVFSNELEEEQVKSIVQEVKEQVEAQAAQLRNKAQERAQTLRTYSDIVIAKMTKQVRTMSAAQFFQLTAEEADSASLGDVLLRLQLLLQGNGNPQKAAAAGELVAALTGTAVAAGAAAGGAGAGGAGTSAAAAKEQGQQQAVQQEEEEEDADEAMPDAGTSDDGGAAAAGGAGVAGEMTAAAGTAAAALMPPPPPRAPLAAANPPARAPARDEVVYSANGSPIYLGALLAASRTAAGAAPSTGMGKGQGQGMVDATPAAGGGNNVGGCAGLAAPGSAAFTGRTFRRATVARGRTKQATLGITVTTGDGKAFTVDDVIGMAGVPQKYRDEVRRLVLEVRRLATADLNDLNELVKNAQVDPEAEKQAASSTNGAAAAAAAGPSGARPTRRR